MTNNNKDRTPGPLAVSQTNPRYFTVKGKAGEERAVYLTGSHIWNNFHDGLGPGAEVPAEPEQNNFDAYLTFLKERNHNFIRLWRWEEFVSQAAGGGFHLNMSPQPWERTGAGVAKDGKPKFDLSKFNEVYFERLRERVIAAGKHGIYVDVMLFDGFGIHLSPTPDNIEGLPFYGANNVNDINVTSILDYQVLPLKPRIKELQEAYIRKVIDTVHDLSNVLYEVANESSGGGTADPQFLQYLGMDKAPDWGDSTEWQYWVIDVVKNYEKEKDYDHRPMGMTMQFPVKKQTEVNKSLYHSTAEWISPGYDDEIFAHGGHPMAPNSPASHWYDNPPAADGRKITITDTDHYAAGKGDALWAWKSFMRGHHPILMDFGIIDVAHPLDPSTGVPPFEFYEPARYAMGDTLRYAERMQLLDMEPRGELSSTEYVLANPGKEYIILQPEATTSPFTVTLESGAYSIEWFSVTGRKTEKTASVTVKKSGKVSFAPPFKEADASVLYLKAD